MISTTITSAIPLTSIMNIPVFIKQFADTAGGSLIAWLIDNLTEFITMGMRTII